MASDPDAARMTSNYPDAGTYVLTLRLHPRTDRIPWLEKALEAARALKDRNAEGNHLGNLGLAWAALGDARKAIEYYEKALTVMQDLGDRRAEGSILGNLGLAWADLGDARKAIDYYEKYHAIAVEIGDRRGEANALYNKALALDFLKKRAEAIPLAEAALEIYEAIEDPWAVKVRARLGEWKSGK